MFKVMIRLISLLTLFSNVQAFASYSTLKLSRSKIRFPHYNTATKKLILDQAKLILSDVFVHQSVKLRDFGPTSDPLPKLSALEKKIGLISDTDFHKSLTDIFLGLKDRHTQYYLPRPFSCYETFLPFSFKYVNHDLGRKAFAVTEVIKKKEIKHLLPNPFLIEPGDLLITYNGIPVYDAVKIAMSKTYGANSEAQFRLAQDDLSYIDHGIYHLPEGDTVDLEFENAKGQRYKLMLPWITYTDDDCIKSPTSQLTKTIALGSINRGADEPILYWHINRPGFGNFAYIELTSFDPKVLTSDEIVIKIRNLLLNELRETDGLVFDLRENGGGQIPLAEKIIQLFSPKEVSPLQYILKNSETNYVYFTKSDPEDPYTALLSIARKLGTPFTTSYSLSEMEEINDLGQVYFKPVAVFVNSKCYSSCEVFAAQIQDHEIGTIFGEDLQTGGGGANVYSLNQILEQKFAQTDPAPFSKLPNGQEISFSFRQALRVGKNAGALIENMGIKVDRLSPMSRSDIFNATNDQLLVLQRYLSSITENYTSSIFFQTEERHDFTQNHLPSIQATWTNTTSFKFKQHGKTIDRREVDLNSSSRFSLPINFNQVSDGKLELYGVNNDVPVWRKIIKYRVIPEFKKVLLNKNLIKQMSIFNVVSTKENGWHKKGDKIIIGDGKRYQNSIESEASLFISIPQDNFMLTYTGKIDSEKGFDFLKIYAVTSSEKPHLLQSLSGNLPEIAYNIDLSSFAGKNIELRFAFKTDEATRDRGVTIRDIQIRRIR